MPKNARLRDRACVLVADVALTGSAREAAGLADNSFDFVIMNPPFNAAKDRATPDALKRQAHVMQDGLFEAWIRSAAAVVQPRAAAVAIIARPVSLAPILAALAGRFGGAEIIPVHPRAAAPAIRIVVQRPPRPRAAALSLLPPLILHEASGDGFSAAPTPSTTARPRFSAIESPVRGHCARGLRMPTCQAEHMCRRSTSVRRFFSRLLPKSMRSEAVTIPVIRLHGTIMAGGSQFRPTLSLASTAGLIEKAFSYPDAPAVAISINSPGGSPVQSRLIYKRIRDLAAEKNKRVLVFVEDVAASGGYMIAVAGDEIIADPSSIVGSIGVVSAFFGFPELLKKIGVERRVYTAGSNKAMLDPFRPEKKEDIERLKELQLEVHETFIDLVKERRGAKLKDDPDLFTGLFWTGKKGLELGLVDALGDMRQVLKDRYGAKTELKLISPPRGLFGRRLGVFGSAVAQPILRHRSRGCRSCWMRRKSAPCGAASAFE